MKQVVLGRCWSNFQDVVGIYWSATAPAPSEHLFWARVRKECLHVSLSQVPHKFHEIMHRRRNRSSEAKFSKCSFDLWQQPIGNGRRYCKIQYNDTGTGSYPLPVEVPSPVLLGVGARSRCRCSRHTVFNIQGRHDFFSCRKLIVGEQLAVLSLRSCQNSGDKPQDRGYLEIHESLG